MMTLDINEAATITTCHPDTVRKMAAAREMVLAGC
jgi:hypothetical protein